MAIKLEDKQNVIPPNSDYPYGDIKDETTQGANDGTPINRAVYADIHQFFARIADFAGVSLNGTPDNLTNGFQYVESLAKYIGAYLQGVVGYDPTSINLPNTPIEVASVKAGNVNLSFRKVNIGIWNMDVDGFRAVKITNPGEDVQTFYNSIRNISVMIKNDPGLASVDYTFDIRQGGGFYFNTLDGANTGFLTLSRDNGGSFDNNQFDNTASSYNRGYILLTLEGSWE